MATAYFAAAREPIIRPPRQKKFVRSRAATSSYELRKGIRENAKHAIGQLAVDLLRGAHEVRGGVVFTQEMIFEILKREEAISERKNAAAAVIRKLRGIYSKHDRLCALDSGTTTIQVAKLLSEHGKQMLPDPSSNLKSLAILTNSTEAAELLSNPLISVDVIISGGRLRKESHAFAGDLARVSLDAWDVHCDVCLVGCIGLNWRRQFLGGKDEREFLTFMSDTYEEAALKQALFSRSTLRTVLVDSSKLVCDDLRSVSIGHFPFASVASGDVDLVITDSDNVNTNSHTFGFVNQCWKEGVPVLIANC